MPAKIPVVDGCKECTKCKRILPLSAFYSSWDKRLGQEVYRGKCKECKTYSPESQRLRLYDLTQIQYELMTKLQGGACKICHQITKLVVDHDHKTGKVRGLLCDSCNIGIGRLKDDPVILAAALDYLTI